MAYRYIKTINNNAIVASDKNKHEVVIMGKAIGVKCNRILGTRIDNELIERVFVSNNNQNYVEAIIEKIPYNMFKVVELVIKQAEQDLNTKFKDAIYLALVDHIYFSYKTIKEGGKIENPLLNEVSNRVMPLRTFVGGFPFSSSGLNDNAGCYVAKDATGGLVVLDFWLRENDRTNSNFVIMGVPGSGKSAAVKHITLSEFMLGTKLIFIDPESEYKDFCKNLNGNWLDAGGSPKARVNPLHIMPIPKNDEPDETEPGLTDYYDKDEGNGLGDLALYIKHLEIFFSLYIPSLTDKHKAVLKKTLIELYKDFDIDWNTDAKKLKPEDFPILSDMYNKLLEKASVSKEEGKIETENIYEDLALFLEDAANGADSALWNGPTTLQTDKQITVLDTYSLQSTSNNVKRAQYFLLETWSWNIMSSDRTEKVALICDEAYLMIDPEVPQSLVFLRNVAKRDRKYEAGLFIISHSVVDFLDPKIKMYGQALLDTPCYKILFGTDGQNLEETDKLYNLTEAERELLESKRRGHALFMIGSKRLHVNFEIPDYKWAYFGKAGGR